ncbi:MAG: hypothetical protein U9P49_06360 [Thermodesulfobacteriota bacterium]|nr:hypothetical protein [Thermodesulfobacteriota bacterium]
MGSGRFQVLGMSGSRWIGMLSITPGLVMFLIVIGIILLLAGMRRWQMRSKKEINREIERISGRNINTISINESIKLLGEMEALIWVLEE